MTIDRILPLGDIRHVLMERRAPTFEMIVGMIANRVSGLDNLREDIRVFVDILADHEEGSFDMIAVENSEHFRRHFGNGSIVESEINRLPRTEDAVRVETLEYGFKSFQFSVISYQLPSQAGCAEDGGIRVFEDGDGNRYFAFPYRHEVSIQSFANRIHNPVSGFGKSAEENDGFG